MKLIEDLKSTTLTNVLIIMVFLILISLWSYAEFKGSVFGIPFNIVRAILWIIITTSIYLIFAKNDFGGLTIQSIMTIVGAELAGVFFLILWNKRLL